MRPLVLIILDGWGYSDQKLGNAIVNARTPTLDGFTANYPAVLLQASGKSVGLNWGEPGNSEVGHLTLGAGRTVFQYSARINKAIQTGEFFANAALVTTMSHAAGTGGAVHLVGLLGSGTVHSSIDHLLALVDMAQRQGIRKLFLHLFTDGKDSGLKEAPALLEKVREHLTKVGLGTVATLMGRQYGMDRDNNWDRTAVAYRLLTSGEGQVSTDLDTTLQELYNTGFNDANVPAILADTAGIINDGDGVIFFNFREDSIRQLARAFVEPAFDAFPRKELPNLRVTLMTQYVELPGVALNIAFPLPTIINGIAEVIARQGKRQLRIAETGKYAHTTYFFNCLHNQPFPGETDFLIESHKNHTEHPEMRAADIAAKLVAESNNDGFDFAVMNFANADIISHMGILELATKGAEAIDMALAEIAQAVAARNGIMIITADHGNAESLIYRGTGEAETRHNTNPVPCYLIAEEFKRQRTPEELAFSFGNPQGLLSDVAPTILELMGTPQPAEMTGTSLLPLFTRRSG